MKEMIQNSKTLLDDPVGEPHLAGFHLISKNIQRYLLKCILD